MKTIKLPGYFGEEMVKDFFSYLNQIECACDDPSCGKKGDQGEVEGHIENCSCGQCHEAMGKI